ncbi:MAG: hypothetical protein JXR83_12000 [Deltaproteobacteria bacterium]|nr:hypothetical protein [Deltaproteobacteria bacterium]
MRKRAGWTVLLVALALGAGDGCDCGGTVSEGGDGSPCDGQFFDAGGVDAALGDAAGADLARADVAAADLALADCAPDAHGDASGQGDGSGAGDGAGDGGAGRDASVQDRAGSDAAASDAAQADSGGADAGPPEPLLCGERAWKRAVPGSGTAMMAYGARGYLFAADGHSWAIVENETAVTRSIPLPGGVTAMRDVTAEIAASGRPLVFFWDGAQRYAAFFDGAAFVGLLALGQATAAHADAAERVYAITANGLTQFALGTAPIVRGALPYDGPDWGVGPDGTVYQLYETTRPSTIHPGDTANDLRLAHLSPGSLTWEGDALVASNEGWGFDNARMAIAADGSFHVVYNLSMHGYYFRSVDGETWEEEVYSDSITPAVLIDPAQSSGYYDPTEVKGGTRLVAAQDYDHVSVTRQYAGGSMSGADQYFIRRCPPFVGYNETWPAERLAFSGLAFDDGAVAVNEHGLASILTPYGVRQDMATPALAPVLPTVGGQGCSGDCAAPLPACADPGQVRGPLAHGVDVEVYGSYDIGPLMAMDDRAFVFVEGSEMWMWTADGAAITRQMPVGLAGCERFCAQRSAAGRTALVCEQGNEVALWPFDGDTLGSRSVLPCSSAVSGCDVRLAADGHAWVYTGGNFHEQELGGFANRGGGPASPWYWDVDAQGTVILLASGDAVLDEVLVTWKLQAGAGGWSKAGVLSEDEVAAADAAIEGGLAFGAQLGTMAPDGSIHLFSDAHCVDSGGFHNKTQVHLRSRDGESWEIETLPDIDTLTGGLLTWRDVAFWAADYERVRLVVMSSPAPTSDGWNWYFPDRRLDVVARCRGADDQPSFTRLASAPLPGWTTRGFAGFSPWGIATLLTSAGLTQIR